MTTTSDQHCSHDERFAFAKSPEAWDFLYGGCEAPAVRLSFEGDPHTWSQVMQGAIELGIAPQEFVRFALYQYLEGAGNSVAARARLLAHLEWCRTRPVWVCDDRGVRWAPADQLHATLTST